MQQTSLFPKKEKICVFTGHRDLGEDFDDCKLYKAIKKMLDNGVYTFLNGMAVGFDLMAAEILLSLKEEYPQICFIACLPCQEQDKYYSEVDKSRYYYVKIVADELVVLSEKYYKGCMQVRDKYMAERADCMIAYCKKRTGGTAYTVRCFQKLHPDGEIIFV